MPKHAENNMAEQSSQGVRNGKETNEVLEAMAKAKLTGRQFQVLSLIIRQTHGYKRAADMLAPAFFKDHLPLPWDEIKRTLSQLSTLNIISANGDDVYTLNMPVLWKPSVFGARASKKPLKLTAHAQQEAKPLISTAGDSVNNNGEGVNNNGDSVNNNGESRQYQRILASPLEVTTKDNYPKGEPRTESPGGSSVSPKTDSGTSPPAQSAQTKTPFKEALQLLSDAKNKPAALFEIIKKEFPDYNWQARASPKSWIGRCGQLLKTFGIRKVLEAFWLTETQNREGDPVSYAHAILIAKGKIPGRGEATQRDFRKW